MVTADYNTKRRSREFTPILRDIDIRNVTNRKSMPCSEGLRSLADRERARHRLLVRRRQHPDVLEAVRDVVLCVRVNGVLKNGRC